MPPQRFCTAFDELWQYFRVRSRRAKHVPLGEQRRLFVERWRSLIADMTGRPPDPNTVLKRLQTILNRASIPRIRLHDLRHAHASHLIADRISPKVVQERLGHSSAQFTLQVYGHLLPGQQQAAADGFAASLSDEIDRGVGAQLTQQPSEKLDRSA